MSSITWLQQSLQKPRLERLTLALVNSLPDWRVASYYDKYNNPPSDWMADQYQVEYTTGTLIKGRDVDYSYSGLGMIKTTPEGALRLGGFVKVAGSRIVRLNSRFNDKWQQMAGIRWDNGAPSAIWTDFPRQFYWHFQVSTAPTFSPTVAAHGMAAVTFSGLRSSEKVLGVSPGGSSLRIGSGGNQPLLRISSTQEFDTFPAYTMQGVQNVEIK